MAKTTVSNDTLLQAASLRADGLSFVAIGKALGVADKTAKRYVEQGEALVLAAAEAKKERTRKEYPAEIVAQVVAMRDEEDENSSWAKISEALHLGSPGTARRIYRNAAGVARNMPLGRLPGRGGRAPWVNVPETTEEG